MTDLVVYLLRRVGQIDRLLEPVADLLHLLALAPVVECTRHVDVLAGVQPTIRDRVSSLPCLGVLSLPVLRPPPFRDCMRSTQRDVAGWLCARTVCRTARVVCDTMRRDATAMRCDANAMPTYHLKVYATILSD